MVSTLSHYSLEEEIGRGGMGVVYRAVDTRLGGTGAIKILPAEATADPDRNRRFVHEARAASALNHPHIVTIHDIGEEHGVTFIAMELVEGATLDAVLAKGPLPIATAIEYARQIAAALAAAHAGGIIHRDIKPGNIIITTDGRAKVLDFGLAKLIERAPSEATLSAVATTPGLIVGTAAYMSPEQAEGRPVDARSDVFSFGAVLYEMVTGRRPFAGGSDLGVLAAILRDKPAAVRSLRPDVPPLVEGLIDRALAKDPAVRYASGADVKKDLDAAHAAMTRLAHPPLWRQPVALAASLIVLAGIAGAFQWQRVQAQRGRDARLDGIPRIEQLMMTSRSMEAVRLARQIERYAPDEVARIRQGWLPVRVETEPAGASIEIRDYADVDGAWERLGTTPVSGVLLPFAYHRLRITKPGYVPLELSRDPQNPAIRLTAEGPAAAGMVTVRGGPYVYGVSGQVVLPDYLIDRTETTNREFKAFVDAGGYRNAQYWTEPFADGDRALAFGDAIARVTDSTGRPGTATWELGTYPEGQDDYPVGGISWFEAAAYARFRDKQLPTIYHWFRAAGVDQIYSDILTLSNFDGNGPTRAGERAGVGPWGTADMAGNVKEWCVNAVAHAHERFILGGGWNEPSYRFTEAEARDPWRREQTFGVRLIKNLGPGGAAAEPVVAVNPDPNTVVPVSDTEFDAYRRFYAYDRTPLDVRIESTEDSAPMYRKLRVSFAAAYAGERVPAYLFLPKSIKPPYQTIVLFPSAYARAAPSSEHLDLSFFEFIVKSGRALLYPIYQGTFERHGGAGTGTSGIRDMQVQWAKDLFRAVDYLNSRDDIDHQRIGYYSISMGAYFAPIPLALEPRLKTAVIISGRLRYDYPPEIQPANFMPHLKVPVLMINGLNDFSASQGAQERYLALLGTPAEHKRRVPLEGGHVPNDKRGLIREVLDWYDKYLGPVK